MDFFKNAYDKLRMNHQKDINTLDHYGVTISPLKGQMSCTSETLNQIIDAAISLTTMEKVLLAFNIKGLPTAQNLKIQFTEVVLARIIAHARSLKKISIDQISDIYRPAQQ